MCVPVKDAAVVCIVVAALSLVGWLVAAVGDVGGCEDTLLSSSDYDARLACPEPTFMLSYAVDVYGVRVDCRCPAGLLEVE